MNRSLWILAAVSVGLFPAPLTPAATLTVDLNGGADYTDIQSAIDAAADGDTVVVRPGEYVVTEPINFNRLHNPENPASPPVKNITVKSEGGAEVTTIRMAETPANPDRASVVVFESEETEESVLEGFTITGGSGTTTGGSYYGGGLYCYQSSPTVTDCTISGNSATWGGGLYCFNSSPTLSSCRIFENTALYGGGVFCGMNSSPTITSCTISRNLVFFGGWGVGGGAAGGLYCADGSSPALTNCIIFGNKAGNIAGDAVTQGGGVLCVSSSPSFTNCTITGNRAYSGGGVYCHNASATLTSCIVWDNVGEAIAEDDSQVVVTRSCTQGDQAWPGEGNINNDPLFCSGWDRREVWVDPSGAVPGDGSEGSPFSDPPRATMGFIYSLALSEGSPCRGTGKDGSDMGADNGSCAERGEAGRIIHLAPGTYDAGDFDLLEHVSLQGSWEGRTIIKGTVFGLQTGSSLSNLMITNTADYGVVILWESPEITNCTIVGNSYGVQCYGPCSPTFTNCTIAGNWNIGVMCDYSTPYFINCTIAMNSACGVNCHQSSSTFTNCIVWGNTIEGICGNFSHNLIDQDPFFIRHGEWIDCDSSGDPECLAYQWDLSNDPTAWHRWIPGDYHLQPGSPAIDAGAFDGAPTRDIEGHGRPCGAGVDIGAYEFGECPASTERFQRGDANADSGVNITDGMYSLNFLFLGGPAPPCADAADPDDSGGINITDVIYLLNFLFISGPAPAPPFDACGVDPTLDELDCAAFAPCG